MLSNILRDIDRLQKIMQTMGHPYEIEVHINKEYKDHNITGISGCKVQYWTFVEDSEDQFRVYARLINSDRV